MQLFRRFPLRPVLTAQSDIAFIAAELDLRPGLYDLTIEQPSIISGLSPAPADGFDLFDGVGPGEEPVTPFKKVSLEVGAQAIADDGDAQVIDYVDEVLDLRFIEELRLIDDDAGYAS